MTAAFSTYHRGTIIENMKKQKLDLLVIGGGVTGAGILLDAQTRGMKVGLVEMQDFAAGTSSRSTKLVHGGLRYLKQFEVKLVAEVGKERAIVYENAPHVTTPEWMLLPIYKNGTFGKFSTSIGLKVYDFLAGVKKNERRKMLSATETLKREPLLKKSGLQGGGYYVEYKTDDARLTLEIMKEAVDRGASAVNYSKVTGFIYDGKRAVGVKVEDQLTGEVHEIYAKKIVNATGPWVDELREEDRSKTGKEIHHTKGIHLVIDQSKFPLKQAVYYDTEDGRMVFAIPRAGKTYVGTTDTDYKGDLANPGMTEEDLNYVLNTISFMFPEVKITRDDVESSWSGLRPLIHEPKKGPSEISRKDEVFHSPSGLLTIAGGKLTGYRKMAEKVVDIVRDQLRDEEGAKFPHCRTQHLELSGGKMGGSENFGDFLRTKVQEGLALGLDEAKAKELVQRYGTNIDIVYGLMKDQGEEAKKYNLPKSLYASLLYALDYEMASTPSDFLIRRISALYFDIDTVYKWKDNVISCMADKLGWDAEQKHDHAAQFEEQLRLSIEPINE
ncbi:glycerol-3-phosphate dehydrogenase/oxidase [Fictibacillus phosphorivorans]|uniref:glycerol-3-phosphate dehydrogenase/oxidase n=1 Tax=Fictibacillus phosphorivorans TaxID=1221500 RepID=UPI00203C8291|nr:glycerol-3-phosphate dehydrogenase/oxidase [Fictibacillus phosphorivorans]MCM3718368.1 glycerol-3-phosphate dehydrogenase/oxidase [Fictibacillus phosphorivorans]MCM3775992.1 glycerol-3-phosphate dehydrogenase/oxidase [Fictibacillus phosphorivorans]